MSAEDIEIALTALPDPDLTDPDNPEWTAEDFARAKRQEDLSGVEREAILAAFPNTRRVGRPPKETRKRPVNLRLDADVVEHFKSAGVGWQTRINAALREVVQRSERAGRR